MIMGEPKYRCKYCKNPMNKIEYEMYHGLCLKCRDLQEWKQILKEQKK
jgi:hypothetical protein